MLDKDIELFNIDKEFDRSLNSIKRMFYNGDIFIYPTDAFYCIGGNPFNLLAVNKIRKLINHNSFNEPTLLVGSISSLFEYVNITTEKYFDLLFSVWPNPVRIILKLNVKYQELFGASKAAFQIPKTRFCLKLLTEIKHPLLSMRLNDSINITCKSYEILKDEYSNFAEAFYYTEREFPDHDSAVIDLTCESPIILRKNKIKLDKILHEYQNEFINKNKILI